MTLELGAPTAYNMLKEVVRVRAGLIAENINAFEWAHNFKISQDQVQRIQLTALQGKL